MSDFIDLAQSNAVASNPLEVMETRLSSQGALFQGNAVASSLLTIETGGAPKPSVLLQSNAVASNPLEVMETRLSSQGALFQSNAVASNPLTLEQGSASAALLLESATASSTLVIEETRAGHVLELLLSSATASAALQAQLGRQGQWDSQAKASNLAQIVGSALLPDGAALEQDAGSAAAASNPLQLTQAASLALLASVSAQSLLQGDAGGGSGTVADTLDQDDTAAAQSVIRLASARRWQHSDSITVQSLLFAEIGSARHAHLAENISAHSLLLSVAGGGAAQASTLSAQSLLYTHAGSGATLADGLSAQNLLQGSANQQDRAEDNPAASDFAQVTQHLVIELLDTLAATDSVQMQRRAGLELLDLLDAQNTTQTDGDHALLWTARTDSLAMSQLQPEARLNSLAALQGTLAASAFDGLHRFTAHAAAPFVQSGWLYPEDGRLWRAHYAYLTHSGAPLSLHLTVSDGAAQTYSYSSAPRVADSPVPSRIRLGRGIRAAALQIGLSAESFALHQGELVIDVTSRRF